MEATSLRRPAPVGAVVFDLGGVLIDWNPRHVYRWVFGEDEAAMEEFLAGVCTLEWHYQHDLGRPMSESCAELAALHPERADHIWLWRDRAAEMIGGPILDTVRLLRDLHRSGTPCYALTNWPAETFRICRERFDFLECFTGIVVSGEEGVAKPDPEIFRRLLRRYRLDPATTLFIDDHQVHIDTARSVGMRALRFDGAAATRLHLEGLSLLPPR